MRIDNPSIGAGTDYFVVAGGTGTITQTATGSSSNIDISLVPKGTGKVTTTAVSTSGYTNDAQYVSTATNQTTTNRSLLIGSSAQNHYVINSANIATCSGGVSGERTMNSLDYALITGATSTSDVFINKRHAIQFDSAMSTNSGTYTGSDFQITGDGTGTITGLNGATIVSRTRGTGTVNLIRGGSFIAQILSNSNQTVAVSTLNGGNFQAQNASTNGTATSMIAGQFTLTNSGTCTNGYAFFSQKSGSGTYTNSWDIYANTGFNSYFAGNIGIGQTVPTAYLHLKAGTASAGTAPIKLTAGVVQTIPEALTIETDGVDFFISI